MQKEKLSQFYQKYKQFIAIGLIGILAIALVVSLGSKSATGNSNSQTTSSSNSSTETVSFFATGEYTEGTDIEAGDYYFTLTDLNFAPDDSGKNGYINVDIYDSKGKNLFSEIFLDTVSKIFKVKIPKGGKIVFDDNYSPSWTVTFYTPEDFKKDKIQEKYSQSSSSSSSSSSTSTTTTTTTSTTTTTKAETTESSATSNATSSDVYTDSYIKVTKNGGSLKFTNVSGQDLILSGDAIFNNSINLTTFTLYVGSLKAGGSTTETISTVELIGQGLEGDKESGETFAGDKIYEHQMKSGETITWNGNIMDSSFNTLSQVSFTLTY